MKKHAVASLVLVVAVCTATLEAQQPPQPDKAHKWLMQLVGEWEREAEIVQPGQPPITGKGRSRYAQ